jgi:hypothetical protein
MAADAASLRAELVDLADARAQVEQRLRALAPAGRGTPGGRRSGAAQPPWHRPGSYAERALPEVPTHRARACLLLLAYLHPCDTTC